MPSLRVHLFLDRLFLGEEFPKIHKFLDKPVYILGKRHRVLFHDPAMAFLAANKEYPGNPKAVLSAQIHIRIDNLCSICPELKKMLEKMEREDRKGKRKRKPKKKQDDFNVLLRFIRDML